MLLATYSIHFVILSILCGGLWWSINWFATEIQAAQAKEEEAKRIRGARRGSEKRDDGDGEAMDTGDDTEVGEEEEQKSTQTLREMPKQRAPRPETQSTVFVERPGEDSRPQSSVSTAADAKGASTGLAAPVDEALKRRKGMGESTGDLSTDSEWEKLSEDSGER
jgi:hypothetical protein